MSKKRSANDAFGRISSVINRKQEVISFGRGSESGWCKCPLCPEKSSKVFALGRGLSSHLRAVHTPWNPSASEIRRKLNDRNKARKRGISRKRMRRMLENCVSTERNMNNFVSEEDIIAECKWEPTLEERDAWESRIHELTLNATPVVLKVPEGGVTASDGVRGVDRRGKQAKSYKESLPPFIQAAANGDLVEMKRIIDTTESLEKVLYQVDRNGSIAEHWAAGGGHVDCLSYVMNLRRTINEKITSKYRQKVRRRDGKTSLHYAARNGKVECMSLILGEQAESSLKVEVDVESGDGTTPLHLACYGGHVKAVKYLIEDCKASLHKANYWGCDLSHWSSMSIGNKDEVIDLCNYLKNAGIKFTKPQRQGHTPLHKAAQKRNEHVIRWFYSKEADMTMSELEEMAREDSGGNKPSDIFESVGGCRKFAEWMRSCCGC